MGLRTLLLRAERHERERDVALICPSARFGTMAILPEYDALSRIHNLRIEAMRSLDAAAFNRARNHRNIARSQEQTARNIIAEAFDVLKLNNKGAL